MSKTQPERKAINKKTRFEVFKRDSFKCQYCGAVAPNVLLVIDHIKPVSLGGTNDLINLITACQPCNAGKSDRPLNDASAVIKVRSQLEELQERREQIEMMMEWQEGLRDLKQQTVDSLCQYWAKHTPGWSVSEEGKRTLKKWLQRFSLSEITAAMDTSATQYLKFEKEGKCTQESWEQAFSKIPGICSVTRECEKDPDLREIFYIKGILRNKCSYFNNAEAMELLESARSWGIPVSELRKLALSVRNWTGFKSDIIDMILDAKKEQEHGGDEEE
ncbi:MAG TPA: HNH endonuclease [Acidobacteriota bacterium]|nr:HNH endonuclease [Acidobacteriota bacterium]HNT17154.1 HNH endonuclease [Acidobacteriota bacterium]